MKELLLVNKKEMNGTGLPTDEILEVFSKSESLEEIKSTVEQANDRLYVTFASVDVRDKSGELIPIDDVIKQQEGLLNRGGPVTDNHTNRVIGRTMAFKVMNSPGTDHRGVLHLNKIFSDLELADEVWKEIKSGERSGSSVGGITTKEPEFEMREGMSTKILNGFEQFETASVDTPANQLALNQAFSMVAKSDDSKPEFFMKLNDKVFKLRPVSKRLLEKETASSPVKKIVSEENKKIIGDKMEKENTEKGDIKDVAMQKIASGESLNKEEYDAMKAVLAKNAESLKIDDEEEKPKEEEVKPEEEEKKKEVSTTPTDDQPEDEISEDANELTSLKGKLSSLEANMGKMVDVMNKNLEVTKSIKTERPTLANKQDTEVKKFLSSALDIATGKTKKTWSEVHKQYRDIVNM